MILLLFIPVFLLVFLANLGQQRHTWARRLTLGLLAFIAGLTFLAGIGAIILSPTLTENFRAPGLDPNFRQAGVWLLITAAAMTAPLLAAIIANLSDAAPHLGGLYWSRPVQATAILLAILYTGGNLAQSALISDPAALVADDFALGLGDVIAQNLAFAALALLGIGAGIRRSLPAALRHLKLGHIGPTELIGAGAATVSLILFSMVGGLILSLIAPDSAADAGAFNDLLAGGINSVGGAIVLGLATGIGEEILYRGALQPVFGLWLTSLIFALHHIQYLNASLLLIFGLGLGLGLVRRYWGTTAAALTHAAYNTTLLLLALAAGELMGM